LGLAAPPQRADPGDACGQSGVPPVGGGQHASLLIDAGFHTTTTIADEAAPGPDPASAAKTRVIRRCCRPIHGTRTAAPPTCHHRARAGRNPANHRLGLKITALPAPDLIGHETVARFDFVTVEALGNGLSSRPISAIPQEPKPILSSFNRLFSCNLRNQAAQSVPAGFKNKQTLSL
jgi:hypothetical protein